jgi:hypothetical protein
VLNGSSEIVATRECFIQPSTCSEAIQSHYIPQPMASVVHSLNTTEGNGFGQPFFKMFRWRILQVVLALVVIYFRYVSVISCVITTSFLKSVN